MIKESIRIWLSVYSGITLIILALVSASSAAAEQCLQAPSRIEPCPNLIYRAALDLATKQPRVFCYCKIDFERLLNKDVDKTQRALHKMEWQQLVAESHYSEAQIKTIVTPNK